MHPDITDSRSAGVDVEMRFRSDLGEEMIFIENTSLRTR